jgi:hypothetical protein
MTDNLTFTMMLYFVPAEVKRKLKHLDGPVQTLLQEAGFSRGIWEAETGGNCQAIRLYAYGANGPVFTVTADELTNISDGDLLSRIAGAIG